MITHITAPASGLNINAFRTHTNANSGAVPNQPKTQAQPATDTQNNTQAANLQKNAVQAPTQTQIQAQSSNVLQSSSKDNGQELTPEEEREVQELKQRDQEVRQHEQAHATVGGPYAGQPQYEFTTGPDGRQYAVGGHVDIDVSEIPGNPQATIRKMDVVVRAALAPAQPSSEDFQVARAAQQKRIEAQNELNKQQVEENNPSSANNNPANPNTLLSDETARDLTALIINDQNAASASL